MTTRLLTILTLCLMLPAPERASGQARDSTYVIISYNIRVDVASDAENAWPHRADRVAALLRFHGADVAGLQEAKRNQIDDLVERLPEYGWYGVGRDDGAGGGEFVPIFYRRDRFSVADSGSFWLSPAPSDPGSVGWDAALPRVTSWMVLEDSRGARFVVYNTHFDHMGDTARVESARTLRKTLDRRHPDLPAVVMGDFNAWPDERPYRIMTGTEEGRIPLRDAAAAAVDAYGPDLTFSSFTVGKESDGRIDFIFITPDIEVRRFGILTDQLRGRYPSDHLPVLAGLQIPK